jgi:quercetin dioxygenase-like cupin family protein
MKQLVSGAKYYEQDSLALHEDGLGVKMWAVALKHTMFTYFEVEPNSHFAKHRHESEQITFVLEGVLFFELEDTLVGVKAGEVIAIPSNLEHAVFTKDTKVKAVDAWSPIMEKYRED